jgi:hypothetical protein
VGVFTARLADRKPLDFFLVAALYKPVTSILTLLVSQNFDFNRRKQADTISISDL